MKKKTEKKNIFYPGCNECKDWVQKTGHSVLNAKDGGTRSVLCLKEISHLSATLVQYIIKKDVLHILSSKGT